MHWTRRMLIVSLLAVAAGLGSASSAEAQMRDFTGRIDAVGAEKLVVESRGGDKLSFAPAAGVVVSGGKQSWSALAKGDWVTLSWQIGDKPRKAHRVVVLPPRGK